MSTFNALPGTTAYDILTMIKTPITNPVIKDFMVRAPAMVFTFEDVELSISWEKIDVDVKPVVSSRGNWTSMPTHLTRDQFLFATKGSKRGYFYTAYPLFYHISSFDMGIRDDICVGNFMVDDQGKIITGRGDPSYAGFDPSEVDGCLWLALELAKLHQEGRVVLK